MSTSNPIWQSPQPLPAPAAGSSSSEWKYEMRRQAQLVIPQLYLGPFQAALNADKMKAMGITHVLCLRDRKEANLIKPRFPDQFTYLTMDISDHIDQNIITIFPRCRSFIEEAIGQGGTVLVHCNGGIAVSPAIVIGYLMWKFNWTYDSALTFVQSKRYCVSPSSFQIQLKEYEPIAIAQKMMEQASASGIANGGTRSKRGMEDDDSDEEQTENEHRRGRYSDGNDPGGIVDEMDLS